MDEVLLSGSVADWPKTVDELKMKRVLVFLAEGFEDAEAACMVDVLGWSRYRPSIATVSVEFTGLHDEVRGAFGTRFKTDAPIEEIDPHRYDAFVIPGGFHNLGFDEAYDERVRNLARAFRERGCTIATMCVGVLPVAEAGLLEGGRAATYALSSRHDNAGKLREYGCKVAPDAVVEWDGIISCSGPAYSEDVAYLLLEKLVGRAAADEVRFYRAGMKE